MGAHYAKNNWKKLSFETDEENLLRSEIRKGIDALTNGTDLSNNELKILLNKADQLNNISLEVYEQYLNKS